jgi:hypothetical protein
MFEKMLRTTDLSNNGRPDKSGLVNQKIQNETSPLGVDKNSKG